MEELKTQVPISRYNCGGFSLKTYTWYVPYDTKFGSKNREDFMADTFIFYDYESAKLIITEQDADFISKEFNLDYFIITDDCEDIPELEAGDILYRLAFPSEKDIEEEYYDYDFHFISILDKNEQNVMTAEKLGYDRIMNTTTGVKEILWDTWKRGFWHYDGPVVVFRKNFTS